MKEEAENQILQKEIEITIDIMLRKLSELSDNAIEFTSRVLQSQHGYLSTLFQCHTIKCEDCILRGVCMFHATIDTILFIEKAKRRNKKTNEE